MPEQCVLGVDGERDGKDDGCGERRAIGRVARQQPCTSKDPGSVANVEVGPKPIRRTLDEALDRPIRQVRKGRSAESIRDGRLEHRRGRADLRRLTSYPDETNRRLRIVSAGHPRSRHRGENESPG